MKQRVSDVELAHAVESGIIYSPMRKFARDLLDARAELAKYEAVKDAAESVCMTQDRRLRDGGAMLNNKVDALREALEAVKHE